MTWTSTEEPHEGDPGAAGLDGGGAWQAQPLPPGALGADQTSRAGRDTAGGAAPAESLKGALADALAAARAGADAAAEAAGYLACLGPHQRLAALKDTARARDVLDATLLRLTASFTPEDLSSLGATSPTDLLITHTGAEPRRASTEVQLAKALTAPVAPLPVPPGAASDGAADGDETDLGIDLDVEEAAAAAMSPAHLSTGEGLGRVGSEHAAGRISTDIAALARRTVASLPRRLQRAHGPQADALLAGTLPGLSHPEAVIACRALAHTLDPDRADRGFDPDDLDKRYLNLTLHADGSVDLRGHFDAITGAELKAAIDHLSKPDPTVTAPLAGTSGAGDDMPPPGLAGEETGDDADDDERSGAPRAGTTGARPGVPVRDERTPGQRRADALALLTRLGRTGDETRGGEPPRIIATATADKLAGVPGAGQATNETTGRPLTTTQLLHLACTAVLHTVTVSCQGPSAAALALGRSVRLFSPAQRRVMLARDGGCVIPGCTSPPGWWEAHHVIDWAAGGPTDVDQGVLLCGRHHLLVTTGVWAVRMVDGVPQVRPPASVDPLQRWVLNPRRRLTHSTARRAEQLLLITDPSRRPGADQHAHERRCAADEGPPPDIPSHRGTCSC